VFRPFVTLIFAVVCASLAPARAVTIVTDIAPVRAIASEIAGDAGRVSALIDAAVSVHDANLRPSDIRALKSADLILWMGAEVTPALAKVLSGGGITARVIDLSALPGVTRLPARETGDFADDHDHDHAGGFDPHLWLDPANARIWSVAIAEHLAELDPARNDEFQAAQRSFARTLDTQMARLKAAFAGFQPRFLQFHDAFQYFETRMGLAPLGALTQEDEEQTSLGVVARLRDIPADCVFLSSESQIGRATNLLGGDAVRFIPLDALGRQFGKDPFTYSALIEALADGYLSCDAAR